MTNTLRYKLGDSVPYRSSNRKDHRAHNPYLSAPLYPEQAPPALIPTYSAATPTSAFSTLTAANLNSGILP